MEFKGTKGRWSIDYSYDVKHNQACVNIDSSISVKSLATVWSGQDENCEQTIADAKLIAKAPEMLKMLNKLYAEDLLKDHQYDVLQLIKSATEL